MAATPCSTCQRPMHADAAVCPHCGARRAGLAKSTLSIEEIHALLVTDPALQVAAPARGILPALLFPHPATHGASRTAELVLTLLGLPLVAIGALSLSLMRRKGAASEGELVPAVTMTVLGGFGLWSALGLLGVATATTASLVGGSLAALWTRAAIRARSANARSRELLRIERPAKNPAR